MKRALVIAVLVGVAVSCLVDRRSEDFECDDVADCDGLPGDRECTNGLCVTISCPGTCDSCGPGKVCNITCNQPNKCRMGVSCPAGYNCQISCNEDCTPVTCTGATSCTVTCSGNASCGPLSCGTASPCTCSGTGCL